MRVVLKTGMSAPFIIFKWGSSKIIDAPVFINRHYSCRPLQEGIYLTCKWDTHKHTNTQTFKNVVIYIFDGVFDVELSHAHFNLVTIWPPMSFYLNERVLFNHFLFDVNLVRIETEGSKDRELQVLTKYILQFIIISSSTLSQLQCLRKIDDTRCCPLSLSLCSGKWLQYGRV